MDIQQLITEARDRQIQQTNAWRLSKEQAARDAASTLEQFFVGTFSADLYAALGAVATAAIDEGAHITLTYQARDYSMHYSNYDISRGWRITRMDPRADDDERRMPSVTINVQRHDDQANVDALVLALSDLDQEPNVPWPVRQVAEVEPEPSAEERLITALREIIRTHLEC